MFRIGLLTAAVVIVASGRAEAIELKLRAHATATGPLLTLADVAEIPNIAFAGGSGADVVALARTPLMPAPAPGTQMHLSAARIRDLVAARGIDNSQVRISGASVVAVTGAINTPPRFVAPHVTPTAVEQQHATPRPMTIDEAVIAGIEAYLVQQTGHADWRVELEIGDRARQQMATLTALPTISGGRAPWTGRQRFVLGADSATRLASPATQLVVTARVAKMQYAVVVKRSIERGQFIRQSDVELQMVERSLPTQAIHSLEDAVGKEARQTLREGAVLTSGQVRLPLMVRRGETVTVFARSGGVVARTTAVARQDGSRGDLVPLEIAGSRDRINAYVTGFRELDVLAVSVPADDFATVRSPRTAVR